MIENPLPLVPVAPPFRNAKAASSRTEAWTAAAICQDPPAGDDGFQFPSESFFGGAGVTALPPPDVVLNGEHQRLSARRALVDAGGNLGEAVAAQASRDGQGLNQHERELRRRSKERAEREDRRRSKEERLEREEKLLLLQRKGGGRKGSMEVLSREDRTTTKASSHSAVPYHPQRHSWNPRNARDRSLSAEGGDFKELLRRLADRHEFELKVLRKELLSVPLHSPEVRSPSKPHSSVPLHSPYAAAAKVSSSPASLCLEPAQLQDAPPPLLPTDEPAALGAEPDFPCLGDILVPVLQPLSRNESGASSHVPRISELKVDCPTTCDLLPVPQYGDALPPAAAEAVQQLGGGGGDVEDSPPKPSATIGGASGVTGSSNGSYFWLRDAWAARQRKDSSVRMTIKGPSHTIELAEHSENKMIGGLCAQLFTIHPSSLTRLAWDLMGFALLSYDIIVIPFTRAFNPPEVQFSIIMMLLSSIFWTVDIGTSCLTGFQKNGVTVMVPKLIFVNYAKTWLIIDIMVVGLDWFVIAWGEVEGGNSSNVFRQGRSLRMLRYLRALRLLRLLKLRKIFTEIQDHLNTEFLSITFTIMRIIIGLCVANHLIACCWYALGEGNLEHSWVLANSMMERDLGYRYATSLHWSLTQFTPASMEIRPYNLSERAFSVVVLLLAMVSFSSFVSTLTASITRLSDLRKNEMRQFWLLRRYLKDKKIPRQLALRVQRYVEYSYARQQKSVQERDVSLLMLLSEPLREEVKAETLGPGVSVHPLFQELHDRLRGFSKSLQALNIAHGDLVFSYGEEATEMFFVTSGNLTYERGKAVVPGGDFDVDDMWASEDVQSSCSQGEELCRGEWACEQVLWTTWSHRGFLSATNDCTLIGVPATQFVVVINGCRPTWEAVRNYAVTFVNMLNEIGVDNCSDMLSRNFSMRAADSLEAYKTSRIRNNSSVARGRDQRQRHNSSRRKTTHAWGHAENFQLWWFRYVKRPIEWLKDKRQDIRGCDPE